MSRSKRYHPAGTICSVGAGTGKYFKRLRAKRERRSEYPMYKNTWDIGDGKMWWGKMAFGDYLSRQRLIKIMRK